MNFSVVINNCNYGAFLRECVESVLAQTRQPDEVVIVDDGSTDDSAVILQTSYGSNPKVKIVLQPRLGQTTAIATGVDHATGDILCLLDSDDRYKPTYLAELEAHYLARPYVDLTFCRFDAFGQEPFRSNDFSVWLSPTTDYDYGYTARLTYFGNVDWIGNYTSTISLRVHLARRLALREVASLLNNRGQGEFPVLLGASLVGGRKFYLYKTLIDYRHHKSNLSRTAFAKGDSRYIRKYYDETRMNFYKRRSHIVDSMKWQLNEEAATIPEPLPSHLQQYRKAFVRSLLPEFLVGGVSWVRRKYTPKRENEKTPL